MAFLGTVHLGLDPVLHFLTGTESLSINVLALSCRAGQAIGAKTLILLVNRKLSYILHQQSQ